MAKQRLTLEQALDQVIGLHDTGQLQQSLRLARQITAAFSNAALAHNVHAVAASACDRHEEAVRASQTAIRLDPDMADAHFNLGNALDQMGKPAEAAGSFTAALRLQPGDRDARFNLALALQKIDEHQRAIDEFETLLGKEPDNFELLVGLAISLSAIGKANRAIQTAEHARSLNPVREEAYILLLDLLQRAQDKARLHEVLEHADAHLAPDNPYVALAKGRLSFNQQNHHETINILKRSSADTGMKEAHQAARSFLLGKAYDKIGSIDEAFAAFEQANTFAQKTARARFVDKTLYPGRLGKLKTLFTAEWVSSWVSPEALSPCPKLVFLVGFPRSGTTLLDTILRSHSQIEVFEETLAVRHTRRKLREMAGDDLDGLAGLVSGQLDLLRQTYLKELTGYDEILNPNMILVDKLPLNMSEAGLIHRLFPEAGFLMALRHPCDCVLSCFMQDFWLNSAMANYTTLREAAELYDRVFSLWQQYRSILPIQVHELRYEDLVDSFDETLLPLLSYLGVEWEDSLHDYAATAKNRELINTPSYNQVVQSIYKSSSGRWQRYEKHMKPVLPTLLPWAKHHGYASNDKAGT